MAIIIKKEQIFGLYGRGSKIAIRGIHMGEMTTLPYGDERKTCIGIKCNSNSEYVGENMPINLELDSVNIILRPKSAMTESEIEIYQTLQEKLNDKHFDTVSSLMYLVSIKVALDDFWFKEKYALQAQQ
jgi:hypothetical protein